jgi:hypothetical protein
MGIRVTLIMSLGRFAWSETHWARRIHCRRH